jgi:hypothetical protein
MPNVITMLASKPVIVTVVRSRMNSCHSWFIRRFWK